jgi:L-serine dehydratase
MNIFDIMGPVMVGPSSSHTAGAVRIGEISRKLLGDEPKSAKILLHGSFASTGKGHGTPQALVAGLLGMKPDDMRIPHSFDIAAQCGFAYTFGTCQLKDAHPNSVMIDVTGESGAFVSVGAASLGGGMIRVFSLDGLPVNFTGALPTLIVHNEDKPGFVSRVSGALAKNGLNVAALRLERDVRGGKAIMVIECDQPIPHELTQEIRSLEGIYKVTRINPDKEEL